VHGSIIETCQSGLHDVTIFPKEKSCPDNGTYFSKKIHMDETISVLPIQNSVHTGIKTYNFFLVVFSCICNSILILYLSLENSLIFSMLNYTGA